MKGISVGIWTFGMCTERYVSKGYKPYIDFNERVKRISALKDVNGIEITYPGDVNESNVEAVRKMLNEHGLKVAALGVELVCDAEWQTGSFSSTDPARRKISIETTKAAMDVAAALGTDTVSVWLGQDGFDYVFQANYLEAWQWLVDSLRQCAQHRPDVRLAVEYKISEPKMSSYVNTGGLGLALSQATGMANVGITLDVGHAFNARENPAQIASVLLAQKRLFHLHLNDNYGMSDDDMPVGTVHWPQFIELFYWLENLGYDGWYSLDLYPYRDDPSEACTASVDFVRQANRIIRQPEFESELCEVQRQSPGRVIQWLLKAAFATSGGEQ